MSDHNENHLDQTGEALSVLIGCIVKTLGELDPTFRNKLENNLEGTYRQLRDQPGIHLPTLEALSYVLDLLKKWSFRV